MRSEKTEEYLAELRRDGSLCDEKMPGRTDDEKIADYGMALQLLAGVRPDDSKAEPNYLEEGSTEEIAARAALARLIRDDMKGFVGELLALAIDPTTKSEYPLMRRTRRALFKNVSQGPVVPWARDLFIVGFIRDEHRRIIEQRERAGLDLNQSFDDAAIAAAAGHFALSYSVVSEIWKRWKTLRDGAQSGQ